MQGYANSLTFDSEMFVEEVEDIGDFFEDLIPDEEEENYSDLLRRINHTARRAGSDSNSPPYIRLGWMDELSGDGELASSPLLRNLSYKSSKSPNNPTKYKLNEDNLSMSGRRRKRLTSIN
ncbi:10311_t:CDS:2 [Entrophospora sp. SA101]|nr:7123_t:CDS:2 [Entrophospora sp. SA101]CAJ0843862.1 10311_t:CDS:2 [Entrophospora sp. SA101]